jgi:chemotaxis regulatin CheY-phosphate phosphatase CheZ
LNDIIGTLAEIRSVFIIGQRTVPFLDEALGFLQEIHPLLEEIDLSIQESNHKMPSATSRLSDVSNATEVATHEILDLVEEVLEMLDRRTDQARQTHELLNSLKASDTELSVLLRNIFSHGGHPMGNRVAELFRKRGEALQSLLDDCEATSESQQQIRSMLSRIMMALQVQDITSQQLASVNHLIESVRRRMVQLDGRIKAANIEYSNQEGSAPGDGTFDMNAHFHTNGQQQDVVEEVMESFADGGDGLASDGGGDSVPEAPEGGQPASQDDIDALFESDSGDPGGSVSQGDIDKLFGG